MGLTSLISPKSRLLSGLYLPIHINLQDNILAFFSSANVEEFSSSNLWNYLKQISFISVITNSFAQLFYLFSIVCSLKFSFCLVCVHASMHMCVYVCMCMNASVWVSDKVRDTVSSATGVKCYYEPPNVKAGSWT